jgi:hypothetical protein
MSGSAGGIGDGAEAFFGRFDLGQVAGAGQQGEDGHADRVGVRPALVGVDDAVALASDHVDGEVEVAQPLGERGVRHARSGVGDERGDVGAGTRVSDRRAWRLGRVMERQLRQIGRGEAADAGHRVAVDLDAVDSIWRTEQVVEVVQPLLDALYRHFRLMEVCPGGMGFKLFGRVRTPAEVAEAAGILADQLGGLTGVATVGDEPVEPTHGWFGVRDIEKVRDRLPWVLDRNEKLVVVARGKVHGCSTPDVHLAITDRRVLFLKDKQSMKDGLVDAEIRWGDLERVEQLAGGPRLFLGMVLRRQSPRILFSSRTCPTTK